MSVHLYLNPRNDPEFLEYARAASGICQQPSELQAALRARYPAVTVARTDRSDVWHDEWTIYRDGVWVDDGVLTSPLGEAVGIMVRRFVLTDHGKG